MRDKYPLVYIEWVDAQSHDDWQSLSNFSSELKSVHSVGFLIKDTEGGVSIAMNLGDNDDTVSMILDIPNHWIEKITLLD